MTIFCRKNVDTNISKPVTITKMTKAEAAKMNARTYVPTRSGRIPPTRSSTKRTRIKYVNIHKLFI